MKVRKKYSGNEMDKQREEKEKTNFKRRITMSKEVKSRSRKALLVGKNPAEKTLKS